MEKQKAKTGPKKKVGKKRANSAGNIRKLSGGHLEGCNAD